VSAPVKRPCHLPSYSIVADLFPKEKLGRALGVYAIGAFIGSGLAFLIGGYVIGLLKEVDFVVLPIIGELKTWQLTFFYCRFTGCIIGPGDDSDRT